MQTIKGTEARTVLVENEQSEPKASNTESAATQAESQKSSGLHKVTPATMKSLKTSYDSTSKHCVDVGSLWKAGRLARGSVNCLRILREITLVLPRAGVAFGNDLAEHGFNILDTIADRFDGKHEKAVVHNDLKAKRKPRWLAIAFMAIVLMYCFNGLKHLSGGDINIISTPPTPPAKTQAQKEEDARVEKEVKSAITKRLVNIADNAEGTESAEDEGTTTTAAEDPKVKSKSSAMEKKVTKAVTAIVKEVLDSK
jgi:hypothetical protein